jgi:hypothetical protein
MTEYTKREQELMEEYFERTGQKLMSREEKYEAYKNMTTYQRNQNKNGIQNAIWARLSLDNADVFDGEDDGWKLKMLQDNLSILEKIASGKEL